MLNQQYQEPWVAIVVDPIRTMSAGKVNLGAFRTYPKVSGMVYIASFTAIEHWRCRVISHQMRDLVNIRLFLWRRLKTLEYIVNSQSQKNSPLHCHHLTLLFLARVCVCRYYPLDVSYFKSSLDSHLLDLLWNKYWVNTLSSCSMITVSQTINTHTK